MAGRGIIMYVPGSKTYSVKQEWDKIKHTYI